MDEIHWSGLDYAMRQYAEKLRYVALNPDCHAHDIPGLGNAPFRQDAGQSGHIRGSYNKGYRITKKGISEIERWLGKDWRAKNGG